MPSLKVLVGDLATGIKDEDGGMCPEVVGGVQLVEGFLTSRVPDVYSFEFKLCFLERATFKDASTCKRPSERRGLTDFVIRAVDLSIVSVQSQGMRGRGALLTIYRVVEKHTGVIDFHVGGTTRSLSYKSFAY